MASMTIFASIPARASAAAAAPNSSSSSSSSSRHLASSSSSLRGKSVAVLPARLSTASSFSSARRRYGLRVTAAGLPPNLAGMMGNMDPEKLKEIQDAYAKAMKDPETAKKVNAQMAQMQGLMNNPMVAKQMQAMNNMIAVRLFRVVRLDPSSGPPSSPSNPCVSEGGGRDTTTTRPKKTGDPKPCASFYPLRKRTKVKPFFFFSPFTESRRHEREQSETERDRERKKK